MHSDLSARTNDQSKLYHLRVKIKVKYTFTSDNQRHAWPSPVVIVTRKPLRERWSQTGRMMSKKGGFRPQRDWGNLGGRVTKREQISDVPPLRIEDVEGITFGTTCPRSEGRFYFSTQDFDRPHIDHSNILRWSVIVWDEIMTIVPHFLQHSSGWWACGALSEATMGVQNLNLSPRGGSNPKLQGD